MSATPTPHIPRVVVGVAGVIAVSVAVVRPAGRSPGVLRARAATDCGSRTLVERPMVCAAYT